MHLLTSPFSTTTHLHHEKTLKNPVETIYLHLLCSDNLGCFVVDKYASICIFLQLLITYLTVSTVDGVGLIRKQC